MKSFKSYMIESDTPQPLHNLMNRSQMRTLAGHEDFHYIKGGLGSTILARHGDRHSSGLNHFVVANKEDGAKYKMSITMTPRGKYYSHDIWQRNEPGGNIWRHIKSGQRTKD
jgi:hypothetical protein